MNIIVLVYKEAKYLNNCINSLIKQAVHSRLILTSSTADLTRFVNNNSIEFALNNDYIINQISSDWNFALRINDSKYFTLAHQDDIYLENFSKEVCEAINKYPEALIYFTDYAELIDDRIKRWNMILLIKRLLLLPFYFKRSIKSRTIKKLVLSFGSPICCPSVTYNKEQLGKFEFSPEFHINLDWDAWWRLASGDGVFVFIPKILILHRIHDDAETTKAKKDNRRYIEDRMMLEKIWKYKLIARIIHFFYRLSY